MIQVINRAFDILELVAKEPEKIFALSEIADEMKLNHGTCANILKTMVQRKYIEQIGIKKGYRLGSMSYFISGNHSYKKDLVKAAKEPMQELSKLLNENSLLGVLQGDKITFLFSVDAMNVLNVRSAMEKHVYDTATGRILLAAYGKTEREIFIDKYGLPKAEHLWKNINTKLKLINFLDMAKETGVATQITSDFIVGIAAPIYNDDKVVASLAVYLPEMRYKGNEKKITTQLLKTAKKISIKLRNND